MYCDYSKPSLKSETSILTIKAEHFNKFNFAVRVLGKADFKYMTREQLAQLSSDLASHLDFYHEYNIEDESEFSEAFIKEAFANSLKQEDFQDVLKYLSTYSTIGNDEDLNAVLSDIFKVDTFNNKSRIVLNKKTFNAHLNTNKSTKSEYYLQINKLFLYKISSNLVSTYSSQRHKREQKITKTLDDQLKELNRESKEYIQWKFNGRKVVPQSINVARVTRAFFSKDLKLPSYKKKSYEFLFNRSVVFYTNKFKMEKTECLESNIGWQRNLNLLKNEQKSKLFV